MTDRLDPGISRRSTDGIELAVIDLSDALAREVSLQQEDTIGIDPSALDLDAVVSQAYHSIAIISPEALGALAETYGGEGSSSTLDLPGSSLGYVPAISVLTYALALNQVGRAAQRLLLREGDPSEIFRELRSERDNLLHGLKEANQQIPDTSSLADADQQLLLRLAELAHETEGVELDLLAHDLAIMALGSSHANNAVVTMMETNKDMITAHAAVMQRALEHGRSGTDFNDGLTTIERAFIAALNLKLEQNGTIPELKVVHDLDGNLVAGENSNLKPGCIVGRIADLVDQEQQIPFFQRIPMGDNLARRPGHEEVAQELFSAAGINTSRYIFADARAYLEAGDPEGVTSSVVTANMKFYAEAVLCETSLSDDVVFGKTLDSFHAEQKTYRLGEALLSDPTSIILMCDNADGGLSRAVTSGRFLEELSYDLRPEHVVFFASRVAGEGEHEDHRLATALKGAGVPFAENSRQLTQDNQEFGYQGTLRLIDLYQSWRNQKIDEGWPTTDAALSAQRRLVSVMTELPSAISTRKHLVDALVTAKQRELSQPGRPEELAEVAAKLSILYTERGILAGDNPHFPITRILEALNGIEGLELPQAVRTLRGAIHAGGEGHASATLLSEPLLAPPEILKCAGETVLLVRNSTAPRTDQGLDSLKDYMRDTELTAVVTQYPVDTEKPNGDVISIIIPRNESFRTKLLSSQLQLEEVTAFGESALRFSGEGTAGGHRDQILRSLRSQFQIAELYYRNPFAQAGGLEKTIREQARVFAEQGYSVKILGGNPPDRAHYSQEELDQFEHVMINGAHERDPLVLEVANALYDGKVHPNYETLYDSLKQQLRDNLRDVDRLVVHNPLFLRNVPLMQALIDLKLEGALGDTEIVAWIHDIGMFTEPEKFPASYEVGSPWWYANTRFPGIHYVGVSDAVTERIGKVPLFKPEDRISSQEHPPVYPGSDFFELLPDERVVKELIGLIDWHSTDHLIATPGRIADRKNPIALVEALSFLDRTKLVILGKPKAVREADGTERIADPYYEQLRETVKQFGIEDKVIFLFEHVGSIGDDEYSRAYAGILQLADSVVALSKDEGFGIDVRNAALFSQVVLVSDIPAFHVNLGEHANFIELNNHPAIVAATIELALQRNPAVALRCRSRTVDTWAGQLRKVGYLFGEENVPLQ